MYPSALPQTPLPCIRPFWASDSKLNTEPQEHHNDKLQTRQTIEKDVSIASIPDIPPVRIQQTRLQNPFLVQLSNSQKKART